MLAIDSSPHRLESQQEQQQQAPGPHEAEPQQQEQQQQAPQVITVGSFSGPQITELAKQVSDLRETVNILISQIQGSRLEVNKENASVNKTFQ
jgi:hypothetical protein